MIIDGKKWDDPSALIDHMIEKLNLRIPAEEEIKDFVKVVLAENSKVTADYNSGKKNAINFLVGKVLKQYPGADPQVVHKLLNEKE